MIRRPPSSTLFPSTPLFGSALMRARWERDKRKQKEPAAPPKRRRAAKVVEPVAPVAEARPKRRRRTAAEVAAAEAEAQVRSEEHTSELQSQSNLVCRLLLAR